MGRPLKDEIESVREAMLKTAREEGLGAQRTLILSQKLDSLMNQLTTEREDLCCPDKPTNHIRT